MTNPITVWLDDEEFAAFAAQASRYGRTDEEHAYALLAEAFASALKEYRESAWARRRAVLEGNQALAAQVDAAVGKGRR